MRGLGMFAPTPRLDAFVLDAPSQLIICYHWLVFLNQVRKNIFPSSLGMLNTKLIISQKLKIAQKKTLE